MRIRSIIISCLILFQTSTTIFCQDLKGEAFPIINLNYKGLETVKELHESGKDKEAAEALLAYYRNRKTVVNPNVNLEAISISREEEKMAEDALEHIFFSYAGFKPLNYGKDIDWTYWPVRDNELRWQLHRQKWFLPMGKMFRKTGDDKYAIEWIFQYMDWVKKNPLIPQVKRELSKEEQLEADNLVDDNNMRYAWRPMEVSNRLADQYAIFQHFNSSVSFTPEFLTTFLWNTHRHADFLYNNYSKEGNHLLFEAQRMLYAGVFFPEFNDAAIWRKSAAEILNREMPKQVYDDGFQFELDPTYHAATIGIFLSALNVAEINGYKDAFPPIYKETVAKMIEAYYNILLPDLSVPMFSDRTMQDKKVAIKSMTGWMKTFPDDNVLQYFVSDGKKGELPPYTSKAFKTSGFYSFRSSWTEDATAMILKAGPPAGWHCQPDNGTFNLMIKGRNFFPDAGSYTYGGDAEIMKMRDWFRQTKVHNTLTLDNKNLETADSKCLLWKTSQSTEILVVENPSYIGLKHRRSVFFVDKKFFVVVDEAFGTATGKAGIHYQMCEGDVKLDLPANKAFTQFNDNNNVIVSTFCNRKQSMVEEEGWVSYKSKERFPRKAFSFDVEKKDSTPVRYITVIMPYDNPNQLPKIQASFGSNEFSHSGLKLSVTVNGKITKLTYQLEK